MKLLKSDQYKIVLEYFKLNENLDSFPALVSDLEKLDLDEQKDALVKLQKFIYKKTKEINKKKKKNLESNLYEKNKEHIERIKAILKNSPLKTIDKVIQLKNTENFSYKRDYTNYFSRRSPKRIDDLIEKKEEIVLDYLHIALTQNKFLGLNINIEQIYRFTEKTSFNLKIGISLDWKQDKNIELRKLEAATECNDNDITLKELNQKIEKFNKDFEEIEFYLDTLKYNL